MPLDPEPNGHLGSTRRDILQGAAVLGLAGAITSPAQLVAQAVPARKPNILFIMADDLGYADVSCYGRRDYVTPSIDRLAAEGMRFTHAYANSAVCSATRTGLITGRYQNRLPIGLEEPLGGRDVGLPPSHPTLPSLLCAAGYSTALIGKWHLGALPKYGPLLSGYDHFWGLRGGGVDYFTHDALGRPDLWDDDRQIREPGYLTHLLAEHAVEVISAHAERSTPFFISLHFNAPHWPWEGPEDRAESERIAASGRTVKDFYRFDSGSMATYAEMVTAMDKSIGEILATLDALGLRNDTIVVFTSDNGGERFSDTWPFSGKKTELLEGGLRIPAIIRWPGQIAAGQVCDQVMISMDWLPTLLSIAGTQPDPDYPTDGLDLGTVLAGGAPVNRTLCWRYLNLSQEACRSGDWKYLKILDNTFLFNVVEDPLERANMKERRPDIYENLVREYRRWNAQMLPLDPASLTKGFTAHELADHYGVESDRITVD